MNAASVLARKEFRQHGWTFVALCLFALAMFAVNWSSIRVSSTPSYLVIVSHFGTRGLIVIALVIGHVLFAREYYALTQRFVEALPVRGGVLERVKYLLGFGATLAVAVLFWITSLLLAMADEPIGTRFVLIMGVRLLGFVFALWSVLFVISLLGRLRAPIAIGLLLSVWLLDVHTPFEFSRFGPMALIDADSFPFERDEIPARALLHALLLGIGFTLTGFALARMREGSVMESLARRMSRRERTFGALMLLGGIGAAVYLGDAEAQAPIRFNSPFVLGSDAAGLEVSYLDPIFEADAHRLRTHLQPRMASLKRSLDWQRPGPTLHIALAPTNDPDQYATRIADAELGLLVGANFEQTEDWNASNFAAFALHQLQSTYAQRSIFEPRHWLLDGITQFIGEHADEAPAPLIPSSAQPLEPLVLQALYADRIVPLSEDSLRAWDRTIERIGDQMGLAVAYFGVRVLEDAIGRAKVNAFAARELGRARHDNIRDWMNERLLPSAAVFADTTGLEWSAFVNRWRANLSALAERSAYAAVLKEIPVGALILTTETAPSGERTLRYRIEHDSTPAAGTSCDYMHTVIPAYDFALAPQQMQKRSEPWPAGTRHFETTLAGVYAAGERIYATAECQYPRLGARVRLGMERLVM